MKKQISKQEQQKKESCGDKEMFKQFFNKSENKKREEDKNKVEVFKKEIKNKEYIKEKEEIKQFINEEIELPRYL